MKMEYLLYRPFLRALPPDAGGLPLPLVPPLPFGRPRGISFQCSRILELLSDVIARFVFGLFACLFVCCLFGFIRELFVVCLCSDELLVFAPNFNFPAL